MDEAGHHQHIYHSRLHIDFGAPVARYQQGDTSATLMTETSSFLSLRHGDARLLAVQAASYFSPGFVPMQELTAHETGWTLAGSSGQRLLWPCSGFGFATRLAGGGQSVVSAPASQTAVNP